MKPQVGIVSTKNRILDWERAEDGLESLGVPGGAKEGGNQRNLERRLAELERKLALYERIFVVTPTKIIIKQSVLVNGLLNADRVYTKRSGNHVELTT
jgi:hypothetical protein